MFGESISREDEKNPIIQCIVLRGEGDKMNCLHGHPAGNSTTQNGSFWLCNQSPSCNFFCTEDEGFLFEKAIAAWRSTKQPHPRCDKHGRLAKMRVVKDLMKASYGRPFFVCSEKSVPCSFWLWGDVKLPTMPACHHGFSCVIRKMKKEGLNKDRKFFCCPNSKETSCNYFDWVPEEPTEVNFVKPPLSKPTEKQDEHYLTTEF